MFHAVIQVLMTFVIYLVTGYVCARKKILDAHTVRGLSAFLMNVTMSTLIIASMQKPFSMELLMDSGYFLLVSLFLYFLLMGMAVVIVRFFQGSAAEKAIWIFISIFPNVGYMGIPLISAVYGTDVIFYISMHILAFNFVMFTAGVWLMQSAQNSGTKEPIQFRKIFLNPPLLATITGFVLFILSISLPRPLYTALDTLGGMTTPLSMLIIGAQLSGVSASTLFGEKKVYWISLIRLVAVPFMMYGISRLLFSDPVMQGVMILLSAMPAAASTPILAIQYESDYALASRLVFITTIFSLLTIPFISVLLQQPVSV